MKTFKPYNPEQLFLLPPALRDGLPEGHLALFLSDVVETALDLTAILATYETGDGRGQPPYHPALLVKLLLYGYCTGKPSSRAIERATYEEIPYRVLAANQHPDHDTLAAFRQTHLPALAALFAQVLRLCQRAGLVTLGHVALDGTKVLANASKHKAMSYGRMAEAERKLEHEIAALLAEAQRVDAAEDARYGKGTRGDELPAELARRESRLAKIREAKAALEAEAKGEAAEAAAAAQAKLAARERQTRETGRKPKGPAPTVPDPTQATPQPKAQRNFTDPESRIMKDGATKSFVQAYNAQAAVDGTAQVIVAAEVTQAANDKQQLVPMLTQVGANCGASPAAASGDAGDLQRGSGDGRRPRRDRPVRPPGPANTRGGARAARGRRDRGRRDARHAPDGGRARGVRPAQGDRGTGVRADQGGAGLPALLVPGVRQGPGGVVADLSHA
jgi:transposase